MTRVVILLVAAVVLASCGTAPAATPKRTPNAHFDAGQTVAISGKGFAPEWLVAVVNKPITWSNTTSSPVTLRFDNTLDASGQPITSSVIAPGKTWRWTPHAFASVVYHATGTTKRKGQIQVIGQDE